MNFASGTFAAIQCVSTFANPQANRARLESLVRTAAAQGAKVIVAPEAVLSGYMREDGGETWRLPGWPAMHAMKGIDPHNYAESVPGPSTAHFAALAAELQIYLTVPLIEHVSDTDCFYNTVVLIGPDGRLLLHYRKLHPWPYVEIGWATSGDRGLQVVDTPYGRLGLLICFDCTFEIANIRAAGAGTLLYSIAWYDLPKSVWFASELPALARKHGINVVGANWSVTAPQNWYGYGQSRIIDRTGKILAQARSDIGDEIVYATLPASAR
jgi:predicted amidohydrolase